jgi:uncharacterized YccA/Bax inhibitor family protein
MNMFNMETALKRGRSFEGTKSLRSHRVYDKLALLVLLTAVVGGISYNAVETNVSVGRLIAPSFVVAMAAMLIGQFKPQYAKVAAPVYALAEGVVLGVISKSYSNVRGGIVPTAIIATSLLFVGCLLVFRTGVVKVTPKFVQMTTIAGLTLFGLYMLSIFGLSVPGINELGPKGMIFGVIGLGIGLSYLFIDFDRVEKAEQNQSMHDTAEWFLAFQLLLSLVMVYINVLRILGSSRRN